MDKTPPKNDKPATTNAPFKKKKRAIHIVVDTQQKNKNMQDNPINTIK